MNAIIEELTLRWVAMFAALAAGEDLPPGRRLRAEGMMEAAELQGVMSADELTAAMAACYQQACGCTLEADFGEDWREFYPFPQIPVAMQRAPVFPSTTD